MQDAEAYELANIPIGTPPSERMKLEQEILNKYAAKIAELDKEEFVGKEALLKQKADGLTRKVVGIELEGRAIPRHGYDVVVNDEVVGYVTTGDNSISTGKSVCMALVKIDYAKLGTPVQVRIHRKLHNGVVVKKRFYDKSYKK